MIALFLLLASGCGQTYSCNTNPILIGTRSETDTREAVLNASGRFIQALMTQNASGLRPLISEQESFQAVAGGDVLGPAPFLQAVEQGRFPIPSDRAEMTLPEFVLDPSGNAIVTYRGQGELIADGKRLRAGGFAFRTIWRNEGGTWRLIRIEQSMEGKRSGTIGW
ncbi:MAG: nuclear transport factor 2 family protein [Rhodothermales bacterium]|nr:nuclear transport factor 2 family protein [Rhodothermales bacterium]